MQHDKLITRSKDKFHRKRNSKSPINIKGKIKELEEQMEKNHKNKEQKQRKIFSPKKNNNLTAQYINVGRGQAGKRDMNITGMRSEDKNGRGKSPFLDKKITDHNKIMTDNGATRPNKLGKPEVKILRMSSDKTGSNKRLPNEN